MRIPADLFRRAGLPTPADTAKYFNRTHKTAARWHREHDVPDVLAELLAIRAGKMPWSGFEGYECIGGAIYAPGHGDGVNAQQLAS